MEKMPGKLDVPVNVAVFVDYENVYKSLLQSHTNVLRMAFFEKLRTWCAKNQRRIVRMVVYCNFDNTDLHESYHQSILQSYGVETVHTSNQGKNYADLKIAIDVLTSMYSNENIDEFFIVSNDKDMTPLLNTIRANKRNASIITTGTTYNPAVRQFADIHLTLEEICETETDYKIIDTIAQNYWEKLEQFVVRQIANYHDFGKYTPSELRYVLSNEIKYLKIMSYELATIIGEFYREGKIFFYRYDYRGNLYTAFAPMDKKDELISLGILQERDIIDSYDIQRDIDELYEKALT